MARKTIALALTFGVGHAVLLSPMDGQAQPSSTFPYQSFVDNFVSPNSSIYYEPANPDAVTYAQKGSLIVSSTAGPGGRWLSLVSVGNRDESVIAADSSMRVSFSLINEVSGLGLWSRNGYFVCNLLPSPGGGSVFSIKTWFGFVPIDEVVTELNPLESRVVVEFDAVGNTMAARAWSAEDPSAVYSLQWEAPTLPAWAQEGLLGLGALGDESLFPSETPGVEYHQMKLKIIPPTSHRQD